MDQHRIHGQKLGDGGSKWSAGAGQTAVRLDGWCEGAFWQQMDDGGGSQT